ncbi:hypothetical protein QP175_05140 [Sphingomonas aerolata]|uniref:hypothetical protein n=1 Tax=Sphingomonas aerolata TaxID=185951 RepID=UPI003024B20F
MPDLTISSLAVRRMSITDGLSSRRLRTMTSASAAARTMHAAASPVASTQFHATSSRANRASSVTLLARSRVVSSASTAAIA